MDTPFIYDRYVTGKNFIGRKAECTALQNLLTQRESICIYEPPKSGKMSIVQQAIFNLRIGGCQFIPVHINLFNLRSLKEFLLRFGSAVIRAALSTPAEYEEIVAEALSGTHFTFDREKFASENAVLSTAGTPDKDDIQAMMKLPYIISEKKQTPIYYIIEEFQNIMAMEELQYEAVFKAMESTLRQADKTAEYTPSFIMTGSKVNAMKFIFEERKFFYRLVEHLPLEEIDTREIIEHVVRGFLSSGKVIERELVQGATALFRCNMWYMNHLIAICDSLSKGFINDSVLKEALQMIISIHEPKFMAMADDLTGHQLNMIRAILDGNIKFSSSEVIEKYRFNSSANVRRLKDALKKKEIITFNAKEEPVIMDPLFEYWIKTYYLAK